MIKYKKKNTTNICNNLDRIKAREIISEAFLQVTRIKPDDPIDFLYN